jgi:fucose 4-O-acetylase-like acetyltransferase
MSSVVVTAVDGAQAQAPPATPPPARRNRAHYVDRLRAGLTALVVVHHVFFASTLSAGEPDFPLGRAGGADEVGLVAFSVMFLFGNQAWFMGLFFLISGVFAAPSLRRKGSWAYLKDRALRLLVPGAIYCAFLVPAALALARAAGGAPLLPSFNASPSNAFVWWWKVTVFPFPAGPVR